MTIFAFAEPSRRGPVQQAASRLSERVVYRNPRYFDPTQLEKTHPSDAVLTDRQDIAEAYRAVGAQVLWVDRQSAATPQPEPDPATVQPPPVDPGTPQPSNTRAEKLLLPAARERGMTRQQLRDALREQGARAVADGLGLDIDLLMQGAEVES